MTKRFGMNSQPLFPNYIVDATDNAATNLKWDSTTVQTYTVPAGKRWLLYGGYVTRDANETLVTVIQDATPTAIMTVSTQGAAIDTTDLLADLPGNLTMPMILDPGFSVLITAGGAQGAGAKATCFVLEYDHS